MRPSWVALLLFLLAVMTVVMFALQSPWAAAPLVVFLAIFTEVTLRTIALARTRRARRHAMHAYLTEYHQTRKDLYR